MNILKTTIAALIMLACGTPAVATASCNQQLLDAVGSFLKVDRFSGGENGRISISACKVLPNDKNVTAVAIVYLRTPDDDGDEQLVISLVDHRRARVIAARDEKFSGGSAYDKRVYALSIDTARYHLSDEVFVFGIDFSDLSVPHIPCLHEGGSGSRLTLFAHDKKKTIRPILSMYRSTWTYRQCIYMQELPHIIEESTTTLAVGKSKTHGYADLEATVVSTLSVDRDDGLKPRPNPKRKPLRTSIRYDGTTYDMQPYDSAKDTWFSR